MDRQACELEALRAVVNAAREGAPDLDLVGQVSAALAPLGCRWVDAEAPAESFRVGPEEGPVLGAWVVDDGASPEERALVERVAEAVSCAVNHAALARRAFTMEARFRDLVESIPYAVYERDAAGRLTYLSARAEEVTGYRAAALLAGDPNLDDLIVPDDRARAEATWAGLAAGERCSLDYRVVRADGSLSWVGDHVVARPTEDGLARVGVLLDRREAKRLEAQVMAQSRLATLGELAAGVAHEVNNPLSGVLNYAQLAKRLASPEDQKLEEILGGILAEGKRIQSITQSLLTFARRPDDESFRPLSPAELVRASLTIMRRQLRDEFVTLSVEVPEDLPQLQARGQELQQVLQNLLVNARYALAGRFPKRDPAKVLEVKGRYREAAWRGNELGAIELSIRDQGVGIDPAILDRLFEPFFTTRATGTGLGLSISRDIVTQHGGAIEVESELGQGTTFRVTIPVYGG